jgi:bifunctional ADP-heptose synthase (sugar kinase/adenylyltransferase)
VDTRTKVINGEAAVEAAKRVRASGKRVKLMTGYFDPLLASHARRIRESAEPGSALFVGICEPPLPILPSRARAELVAALGMVDYVILSEAPASAGLPDGLEPDEIERNEAVDQRLRDALIQHVQSRHS